MVAASSVPAILLAATSALWRAATWWGEDSPVVHHSHCSVHYPQEPLAVTCFCEQAVTCSSEHVQNVHCTPHAGRDWAVGLSGGAAGFAAGLVVGLGLGICACRRVTAAHALDQSDLRRVPLTPQRRPPALQDVRAQSERPSVAALPY